MTDAGTSDLPDLTDLGLFAQGFPHEVFRELRRTTPVWWHEPTAHTPDGEGFWVLTRHDDILAAAADAATFSSDGSAARADRGHGGGTLIEDLPGGFAAGVLLNMQDDPRHQRIRSLVTPAVTPRALAALEPELRTRAEQIIDVAVDKGDVDFVLDVAAELPLQAIAQLMGVPQEDRHQLFAWANVTLDHDEHRDADHGDQQERHPDRDGAGRLAEGVASDEVLAANAAMFAYATDLVERKRRHPDDGIISRAVHGRIPGEHDGDEPLSELELQMFFNLLVAAGSETTRNTITAGLIALVERPDQWRLVEHDRSLLPRAADEMLRWASSTTYNRRTATAPAVIRDQAIAPGDKVTLWWPSANFDEDVFGDPTAFLADRHPNRHLAFGHGSHFCLGAALARLEIALVFDTLLSNVRSVELTGVPEWTRSNKHTGFRHLPVRFHPR